MSEAWTRKEGKNPKGGLNEKGRKSYEAANPGSDLKAPQPKGGSRKKSFCARMGGMKKKLTSSKTANDPNSRINKSLRAWKCEDGGEIEYKKGGKAMKKFKPHMMYGDGKAKKANTNAEHLALKKKGWGHSKPKMQSGGYLQGKSHKQGGIPAIIDGKELVELEGGEYIIRKSSVDKLGKGMLKEINEKGRVPKMAKGGKVSKNIFTEQQEQSGMKNITLNRMKSIGFNPNQTAEEKPVKKEVKKKSGPNWSNAPKSGTQERVDWYKKHNLKLDKTTNVKASKPKVDAPDNYGETGMDDLEKKNLTATDFFGEISDDTKKEHKKIVKKSKKDNKTDDSYGEYQYDQGDVSGSAGSGKKKKAVKSKDDYSGEYEAYLKNKNKDKQAEFQKGQDTAEAEFGETGGKKKGKAIPKLDHKKLKLRKTKTEVEKVEGRSVPKKKSKADLYVEKHEKKKAKKKAFKEKYIPWSKEAKTLKAKNKKKKDDSEVQGIVKGMLSKKKEENPKFVNGGYMPSAQIPVQPKFRQGMRMMGYGGAVSSNSSDASGGDPIATHTHSGYKAGE